MNKNKRIVYVAGYGGKSGYANWLHATGFTNRIDDADLVLAIGGSDVSPNYYGQPNSGHLYCSRETDVREYGDLKQAIELNKKIWGTCKGLQFLSALAGGAVFQHVEHPFRHKMTTKDGLVLTTNSLHHNLCDLSKLKENEDYKLLAWTKLSNCHINGYGQDIPCDREPEVVYFPKVNACGAQGHPEMFYYDSNFHKTMNWMQNEVLEKFMSDKL